MNKLLETTTKYPQTAIWNDSCSCQELEYAIVNGAVGATTNPIIVGQVLEQEFEYWQPVLKDIMASNPLYIEDDLAWAIIKQMAIKAARLLEPIYDANNQLKGRISLQTNAKYFNDVDLIVKHGCELATVVPNSQIKAPTSQAGVAAFEELTYQGISINATVSFTVAQAIAVAKAVERGLDRRTAEGLSNEHIAPVCTLMVGRLDDYLKGIAKDSAILVDYDCLDYAGVAVMKEAYRLYQESNYRTRLLVAAFRNHYHWSQFIGGDVVLTIPYPWQVKYNNSDIEVVERMSIPVEKRVIDQLLKMAEFRKAYLVDGLSEAEFASYGAFKITMNSFLSGYDKLLAMVRPFTFK